MLGEALRAHLISDSTLNGLIGERIHPALLPQRPTLPAISYQLISLEQDHTLDVGMTHLKRHRVQFDVWADTYLVMEAVNDALRAALDGFKGDVGGSPPMLHVQGAFLEQEREVPGFESEPELFRRSADYYVWVQQ